MFLGVSFANRIHLQGATNVEDVDTVMWTEDLNLEYVLCAFININLILQNVLLLLLFRWHYSPMQNLKHGSGIINIIYIYIYIYIYIESNTTQLMILLMCISYIVSFNIYVRRDLVARVQLKCDGTR